MMKHNSLHDDPMSPSADLVLSKGLQDGLVIFCSRKRNNDASNVHYSDTSKLNSPMEFPIEMCSMLTFQFLWAKM